MIAIVNESRLCDPVYKYCIILEQVTTTAGESEISLYNVFKALIAVIHLIHTSLVSRDEYAINSGAKVEECGSVSEGCVFVLFCWDFKSITNFG